MPVRIKVRGIQRILDPWNPWSRNLLAQQLIHVNDVKPCMIANVHVSPSQASETIGLTTNDETLNQILGHLVDGSSRRERVLDLHDALEQTDLVCSVGVEWRTPNQHLVNKNTKGPVVNTLIVTLGQNDLWCEVFWSTAKGVGLVNNNLGETQIDKNTVTLAVNEDVLWFQITVTDASVMKVGKRLEDTGSVETRVCIGDTISCFRMDH
mmetsp:Transcript_18611/g.43132  ORF Transcript_18611/g.43132 Transcript_18611/m.43132 type:complete len:209 (-) Transcript_18611:1823-2449(-)